MASLRSTADLLTSIRGVLTGINLNNVVDLEGKCVRAASTLLMKADVAEMQNRYAVDLFDGVFDYAPPPTIFGSLIQDVRPQGVSRDSRLDVPYKKPLEDFDRMKQQLSNGVLVTFEQRGNAQIMRLAGTRAQARITLDTFSVTTGWAVGGSASGLAQDQTVFYESPAAVRFNLAAAGTQGYIEKTINSANLSAYSGVGVAFLAVRIPNATAITSMGVRIGSSSANYWQVSNTAGYLGAFIVNDWFLVMLDLANATTVGTPTTTAMTYVRVFVNYDGTALSNVYIGNLFVALRSPSEIIHETPAIFVPQNSTTPQTTISSRSTDSIILGDAAYHIYTYECAREIALGKGGTNAGGVIAGIDLVLEGDGGRKIGLYQKYRGDNPSSTLRTIGTWD